MPNSTLASESLRLEFFGRTFRVLPAVVRNSCDGCHFYPTGSTQCGRAKEELDLTYRADRPEHQARGCATEDTVFIEDTEAGWDEYLKATISR